MQDTTNRKFVCTRPKLATELIKRGHKPTVEPSPWDGTKTAWIFTIDEDLKEAVNTFYARIGKRSPLQISDEISKRFADAAGREKR